MKVENIKFKAKSILDGAWVQGDLVHKEDGAICILRNGFNVSEVDPATVCQFTGLTDCEGNEIWEEDIIKDPYLGKERTIEWNNHLCSFTALDETNSSDKPLGALVGSLGWYVIDNKFDKEK